MSPSSERGSSFNDDMCRFIIFAKAPFLNLGDKMTSTRAYSGKMGNFWYKSNACQTVVQGAGRGMRHKDDYCVTYLLDGNITKMMIDSPKLFPKWFRDAVWFE